MIELHNGDCKEVLKSLPDNSVDSIVTDPPYELGFMGKSWDSTGIANDATMWAECLRVLKPGGHLLAFSGTRTYHRMASAIEDAGFEIRDMIEWVYGSGFPKSLNIGKKIDQIQGNEREVIGKKIDLSTGRPMSAKQAKAGNGKNINEGWDRPWRADDRHCEEMTLLTKGTSEWEGWGTALKPAHEPICMARKPISEKTVAENCLKWGTGGINIDESRVGIEERTYSGANMLMEERPWNINQNEKPTFTVNGRFPANLIHDGSDEVVACFPETGKSISSKRGADRNGNVYGMYNECDTVRGYDDNGGSAARFFKSILYYPKASKSERNKGCDGLEEKQGGGMKGTELQTLLTGSGNIRNNMMKNNHPTVKPVKLMEYLIEMVTPENGTVLDPFMGSGTTGVAAVNLNRNFIGIELDAGYFEIAKKRINQAKQTLL